MRALRRRFQMIFQDPFASLNPRWRVRDIVAEPIVTFGLLQGDEITREVDRLLEVVGLSAADAAKFPHEFSGGQRQRIAIARALSSKPEFIVCDEPTSALDVSVQAQILNLMRDLQDEFGLTYLLISHDLSVVAAYAKPYRRFVSGPIGRGGRCQASVLGTAAPLHADVAGCRARSGAVWSPPQTCSGRDSKPESTRRLVCVSPALSAGARPSARQKHRNPASRQLDRAGLSFWREKSGTRPKHVS